MNTPIKNIRLEKILSKVDELAPCFDSFISGAFGVRSYDCFYNGNIKEGLIYGACAAAFATYAYLKIRNKS